jgi:hypothetical protein
LGTLSPAQTTCFPATASAEGRQFNGAPFPATASAEGAQFNVPPSPSPNWRGNGGAQHLERVDEGTKVLTACLVMRILVVTGAGR